MAGGGGEFAAERLVQLRAERDEALAEEAADKEAGLSRAARLRREANSATKSERKVAGARKAFNEAVAEVEQATEHLQKAHDWLEQVEAKKQAAEQRLTDLEADAQEARERQERPRAPADAGELLHGLFLQMRHLEAAYDAGNFATAWAATLEQVDAVEELLEVQAAPTAAEAPAARQAWAESCPMEHDFDDDPAELAAPQPAAERGQAERRGAAAGAWPRGGRVQRHLVQELAAEGADVAPLCSGPAAGCSPAAAGSGTQSGL